MIELVLVFELFEMLQQEFVKHELIGLADEMEWMSSLDVQTELAYVLQVDFERVEFLLPQDGAVCVAMTHYIQMLHMQIARSVGSF